MGMASRAPRIPSRRCAREHSDDRNERVDVIASASSLGGKCGFGIAITCSPAERATIDERLPRQFSNRW